MNDVPLNEARYGLLWIWLIGLLAPLALLIGQSIGGFWDDDVQGAWQWFGPNIGPTLLLMIGVVASNAVVTSATPVESRRVNKQFYSITRLLPVVYVVIFFVSILGAHFHGQQRKPIQLLAMANYWLAFLQIALCAIFSNMEPRLFTGFRGLAAFWAGLLHPSKGPLLLGTPGFSGDFRCPSVRKSRKVQSRVSRPGPSGFCSLPSRPQRRLLRHPLPHPRAAARAPDCREIARRMQASQGPAGSRWSPSGAVRSATAAHLIAFVIVMLLAMRSTSFKSASRSFPGSSRAASVAPPLACFAT
jgi:hypothetical protein